MGPWLLALFVFVVCGSCRRSPPGGGRAGLTCRAGAARGRPGRSVRGQEPGRPSAKQRPGALGRGGGLGRGGRPPYPPVTLPSLRLSPASHLPDDPEHPPGRLAADGAGVPAPAALRDSGGGRRLLAPSDTFTATSVFLCLLPRTGSLPGLGCPAVPRFPEPRRGPGARNRRREDGPCPQRGMGEPAGHRAGGGLPEELKRFPTRRSQGTWGLL